MQNSNNPVVAGGGPLQLSSNKYGHRKIINGYEWGAELGKGAWGKVRRVVHTETGEPLAVKILYRSTLSKKIRNGIQLFYEYIDCPIIIESEFKLVQALDHENVIKYKVLDDKSNPDKLYLFMELCEGSIYLMLSKAIDRSTFIKDKFRQLLLGLEYLHSVNVSHHDIKTENILIDHRNCVKISDFGVAEKFDPAIGCKSFFGTPAFQAPEIASNINGEAYDGCKADIWSAGVVLFHLITNRLPFEENSIYLLLKSIDKDPVRIPKLDDSTLQDLLTLLLTKDVKKRPTATEALMHPWLNPGNDASSSSGSGSGGSNGGGSGSPVVTTMVTKNQQINCCLTM